jgi:thioesterase domain-containing protein
VARASRQRELVGIDDDFFEAGGDSLLAATLSLEVEARFGLHWAPSSILERSTIAVQAQRIREAVADQGEAPVVWLGRRGRDSGRPLFCIPAVDGYGFVFRALARRLEERAPLAVLQYPGLDGRRAPHRSVAALAHELAGSIEREQPRGPVRLLGHSHGGLVGLEISRELGRRGRRVEMLLLCDAHVPGAIGWMARRLRDLEIAVATASKVWRETRGRESRARVTLGALGAMGWRGLARRGSKALVEHRIHQVRGAQLAARRHYRGNGPVAALDRVVLLRAAPGPGRPRQYLRLVPPDNGWGRLLGSAPTVERIVGDHIDMLHEPNVGPLAERVAWWLAG